MTALSVLFMAGSIAMCSVSTFQRPVGQVRQVIGVVESAGPVEKFSAAAYVRLPNGNGVTIRIPRAQPILAGSRLQLTESTQNFGPARYEFVRTLP